MSSPSPYFYRGLVKEEGKQAWLKSQLLNGSIIYKDKLFDSIFKTLMNINEYSG